MEFTVEERYLPLSTLTTVKVLHLTKNEIQTHSGTLRELQLIQHIFEFSQLDYIWNCSACWSVTPGSRVLSVFLIRVFIHFHSFIYLFRDIDTVVSTKLRTPEPSKPCTSVVRHISLTSCIIMNLWGPCAHPVLISFLFPVTTYILDLVLFVFPLPESGIHYPSASANLTRFLLLDAI